MGRKKRIIILGGGLSGLAAGDLLSREHEVVILEKNNFLGGLAGSFRMEDCDIPNYYHHVISHNNITRAYLDRYNLLEGSVWKPVKIVIGYGGKTHNITSPIGLLGFDYLSFLGRFRFGLFGLYSIFLMKPEKIKEGLDAENWLKSIAGNEVTDKVFANLYARNKFNIPLKNISANQMANRLKEREVYDNFTYPPKGIGALVNLLENEIKGRGGIILKNCKISKIDLAKKVVYTSSHPMKADLIISTIPLPEFIAVAKGLPLKYKNKLSKIRYCPAVGVTFGTEDFLENKCYWINLFDERIHVVIQHSVLFDDYPSKINWCIRYGGSEEDIGLPDEKIIDEYIGTINKYFPDCKVKWTKVFRDKYAEPVYDKDYSKYVPDYRTPVDGLYLAGIQVTYPKIRNMNSALESGIKVSKIVEEDLEKGNI